VRVRAPNEKPALAHSLPSKKHANTTVLDKADENCIVPSVEYDQEPSSVR
jgi:hypothetical protein